jgi:hypothetical protein
MRQQIEKCEFIERFVAYMLKHGGDKFDDGSSIEDYAREMAPSYCDDWPDETPEESASADMDCWEHSDE